MNAVSLTSFSHTLSTITVASLILSACLLFSKFRERSLLTKLPALQASGSSKQHRLAFMESALKMYSDGYKQVTTYDVS